MEKRFKGGMVQRGRIQREMGADGDCIQRGWGLFDGRFLRVKRIDDIKKGVFSIGVNRCYDLR